MSEAGRKQLPATLCWECRNATRESGICSWACSFEPVEGWNAIPTVMIHQYGRWKRPTGSYCVLDCPLFELDANSARMRAENERKQQLRLERARAAAFSVLPEKEQAIMRLRYIDGMKWKEVAYTVHYGKRWCLKLHARALKRLEERGLEGICKQEA